MAAPLAAAAAAAAADPSPFVESGARTKNFGALPQFSIRIFSVRRITLKSGHRYDFLIDAATICAVDSRGMTEGSCRKSPANTMTFRPKGKLLFIRSFKERSKPSSWVFWLIPASSQRIILAFLISLASPDCFGMLHVDLLSGFNGNLK